MSRLALSEKSVRDCFSTSLMELCREKPLAEITVAALAQNAGLTRQTFYNHFSNIDDLVYYAGSRHLIMDDKTIVHSPACIRKSYEYVLEHKEFFTQLAVQSGPRSYQERAVRWLKKKTYESDLNDSMTPAERLRAKTKIDLFHAGAAHVMFEWIANGFREPLEVLVDAVCDMLPDFMRNEAFRIISIDYPK